MSDTPCYLTTLDHGARWGVELRGSPHIEPMFSDFKSRGFGLGQSQLRAPERLARLLMVMSLALYFAVSTGLWDAATHPSVDEKKLPTSTSKSDPQPIVLVHARRASHRQAAPVPTANSATLGIRMKLFGGERRIYIGWMLYVANTCE